MKAKLLACTGGNELVSQLSNNIGFFLTFMLLFSNQFIYVQSVSSVCDPSGSKHTNECKSNIVNEADTEFVTSAITNRTGKFLFDTLFNIRTPLVDDDFDDDDDDDVKTCNCGEFVCVRSFYWLTSKDGIVHVKCMRQTMFFLLHTIVPMMKFLIEK